MILILREHNDSFTLFEDGFMGMASKDNVLVLIGRKSWNRMLNEGFVRNSPWIRSTKETVRKNFKSGK